MYHMVEHSPINKQIHVRSENTFTGSSIKTKRIKAITKTKEQCLQTSTKTLMLTTTFSTTTVNTITPLTLLNNLTEILNLGRMIFKDNQETLEAQTGLFSP